jgi:mRNA interferase RelE/StbE
MPNLKKLLSRFDEEERKIIEILIKKIVSLNWKNLDIKKLKGYEDVFRVRKGKIRIIFSKNKKEINIISIERRCEDTYNL